MSDTYHHGDLKTALIETGIQLLGEGGEENFSLRKVALACGVSSAAPYAHFSGKEELIAAMQQHVTQAFMAKIKEAVEPLSDNPGAAVVALGKAYVRFFLENPGYYRFLFSQPCLKVDLDLSAPISESYPPYSYLKNLLVAWNEEQEKRLSEKELEEKIVHNWAMVHGLSGIASMEGVTWSRSWDDAIESLIRRS